MSDFKTKMHQIRFRLLLRLRTCWRSLQRPQALAGFKGPSSKEEGKGGEERKEMEGRGKEGRGAGERKEERRRGRRWMPPFQIRKYATAHFYQRTVKR